jgi:hypothetical protein
LDQSDLVVEDCLLAAQATSDSASSFNNILELVQISLALMSEIKFYFIFIFILTRYPQTSLVQSGKLKQSRITIPEHLLQRESQPQMGSEEEEEEDELKPKQF